MSEYRCRRHTWYTATVDADGMCPNCITPWKCNGPHLTSGFYCLYCPAVRDEAAARRGRNNAKREAGGRSEQAAHRGRTTAATQRLILAIEAEASAPSPETLALVRGARNLSDRRTLDGDGFWVSQKEMRALDIALDAWLAKAEAGSTE